MSKQTTIEQIEISENGQANIRIGLYVLNGEQQIDCKWHRTSIENGDAIVAQFESVNSHLVEMGYPSVSDFDIARVKSIMNTTQGE